MLELKIVVDTNDADYVTFIHEVSEGQIEKWQSLFAAIKSFEPYKTNNGWEHHNNFPFGSHDYGEYCRSDLQEKSSRELYGHLPGYDEFEDIFEWNGFHSIDSITLQEVIREERLV